MTPMLRPLALAFLSVLLAPVASAQETPLAVGRAVERGLEAGQRHAYTLDVAAGQFVVGRADQHGIDVVLTVTGPAGEDLGRFDSPNGPEGAEAFSFTTGAAGTYRIVVAPFEAGAGRYALVVRRVEPLATTPEARVDQLMAHYDEATPGAVIAVVRGGEVVFANAYGMANLTHGVTFADDTRTNIGSTSKQFTAAAIALLAAEGRLSLDDDVRTHIPELPDFGQTVTLRHLLTHTSGYREFLNALALAGRRIDAGDHVDREEIVALVRRQPALQNAPGAEWNYNNTAFALLTTVVERVTGEPFPDWMDANVFGPLGMNDTAVRADPGQIVVNSAQGYAAAPGGFREVPDLGGAMGAGGIYTTVADLARWMANFRAGDVGGPDFFATMTTPFVLTTGDTTAYGLGLFVDEYRGLRRVHHGGADNAHRAQFVYFPELDGGVIALSNDAAFNADQTADALADLFFGDRMAPEDADDAPATTVAFDAASYDPASFDVFAGRYELAPGFVLAFRRDGSRLLTQATGQPEVEIFPLSDSMFTLRVVDAQVTFHRDAGGTVTGLTLHQNGDHPARRLADDPAATAPVDLADYEGRYYSEELEAFYTLAVEDGILRLRHRRFPGALPLAHTGGDAFTGGFPVVQVAFERDDAGRVVALRAGNGRTRDVRFERVE